MRKKTIPLFLWPFVALWKLLLLALIIRGRVLGIMLAVRLMIVGVRTEALFDTYII